MFKCKFINASLVIILKRSFFQRVHNSTGGISSMVLSVPKLGWGLRALVLIFTATGSISTSAVSELLVRLLDLLSFRHSNSFSRNVPNHSRSSYMTLEWTLASEKWTKMIRNLVHTSYDLKMLPNEHKNCPKKCP